MKDNIILTYRCLQVYIEMNQPVMAASLCLELGNALKVKLRVTASSRWISCSHVMLKLWISTNIVASGHPLVFPQEMNRPGEAIVHYQRAAELQTQTPIEALLSMGDMATCKILTREYSLSFDPKMGPRAPVSCVSVNIMSGVTVLPQGTTMVLCQCLQTCSWCARRKDCSYQAPTHQLVRTSVVQVVFNIKTLKGKQKCFYFHVYLLTGKLMGFFSFFIWSLEKVHFWTLWQNVRFPEFYCWCCLR